MMIQKIIPPCSLDSGTVSDSIDVSDNSKAEEDGEEKRKDAVNESEFILKDRRMRSEEGE
jgi:hypothetical protein